MKNKLIWYAFGFFILTGCVKKADDLFDKSPDQRLNEALTAYQQALTTAPNGWKVYVYPKGLETSDNLSVGGFSYFMKFTDANRVAMYSDFDTVKAAVSFESGYRLKAAQRPSIYFDNYSYIHVPADPDATISQSPTGSDGKGWGTDFEFAITDEKVQGDTIHLKGNQNNSIAIMVKATKAEADAYAAGGLKASMKKLKNLNALGYFKKMSFGSKSYFIRLNEGNKTITFLWLDGSGKEQSFTTGYLSTLEGILFTIPFSDGTQTIYGINFTTYDPVSNVVGISINGVNGTIVNNGSWLTLDVDAPERWWQYSADRDSWWTSFTGFTINGVTDALGLRNIPNFYAIVYWSAFNPAYDAF